MEEVFYFVCLIFRRSNIQGDSLPKYVETSIQVISNPVVSMEKIHRGELKPKFSKSLSSQSASSSSHLDVEYAYIIGPTTDKNQAMQIKKEWKKSRGPTSKVGSGMFIANKYGLMGHAYYEQIFGTPKNVLVVEEENDSGKTFLCFFRKISE